MPLAVFRVVPVGQPVPIDPGPPAVALPGFGPVQGQQLVEVSGDGFVGSPDGTPRVRVSFGSMVATSPRVMSSGRIRCETPPSPIPVTTTSDGQIGSDASGLVDVRVEVLDDDGVVIDVADLADGYEYRREPLDDAVSYELQVVSASLALQLRRDLLPRVYVTDKSIEYVEPLARLPFLTLVGPTITSNPSYERRGGLVIDGSEQLVGPTTRRLQSRPPVPVDLVFGVEIYVGEEQGGTTAVQALQGKLIRLLRDRPRLVVYADCTDPTSGVVAEFRLIWDPGAASVVPRSAANNDSLRASTSAIRVVGVMLRAGVFAGMGVVDVVSQITRIEVVAFG